MVNISKTKRNFIGLNTLFAILSGAAGALILHIALPGHYFGGYPFIPIYFYVRKKTCPISSGTPH